MKVSIHKQTKFKGYGVKINRGVDYGYLDVYFYHAPWFGLFIKKRASRLKRAL